MALKPFERLQNLQASFEKYLQDNLVTVEGLPVAFPGVPFNSADQAAWVELFYLGTVERMHYRRGESGATTHAEDRTLLVQLSLFARNSTASAVVVGRFTLEAFRDKLHGYLHKGICIPVKDYANGGTTVLGQLQVMGWEETPWGNWSGATGVEYQAEIRALAISLELRFTAILGDL